MKPQSNTVKMISLLLAIVIISVFALPAVGYCSNMTKDEMITTNENTFSKVFDGINNFFTAIFKFFSKLFAWLDSIIPSSNTSNLKTTYILSHGEQQC